MPVVTSFLGVERRNVKEGPRVEKAWRRSSPKRRMRVRQAAVVGDQVKRVGERWVGCGQIGDGRWVGETGK